ncbi:putative reverse transcriptase domain-containing protein [Tanacetum coccineum]
MQPVAPSSPDYIPGSEEPQTPPVPQDKDEHEPMFKQSHDPDYVPKPIYLEYIPLEDEHEFPAKEQPLPPVVSPTAKSPGYVVESDPEEDPKEYEDDATEDGPVDYPRDEGEDGDDDDGNSSGDDADDEDEDEGDEDDEEVEHLAPVDSAVVVPTVELVSLPKGIEPVIPPLSPDISTTGARITVRLQASISLPPEAEVERLFSMPTPSPSPPISLSPPSAGERIARCTAPPVLSSPPPVPSPLLPLSGCLTQTQTLRIASTQALIDAVTAALPSPPLPPSLYIPLPVDRRNDLPESEQPPRKRLCLSTLGSRYEVGKSSTARPTGDPAEAVHEIAPMTVGEVNTRVTGLVELHERDTQDLYALLEDVQDGDSMDYGGGGLCFPRGLGSLDMIESGDPSGASDPPQIMAPMTRRGQNTPTSNTNPNNMTPEFVQAMIDQALQRNSTNGDASNSSYGDDQRNVQTVRPCFYADFMKCQPLNFKGTAGGHFKRDYPKLKNKDGGNRNAQGWVYAVGNAEKGGNASGNPDSNVVTGTFLLNNHYASILFDTGANKSFISTAFSSLINIA